MMQPEKFQKSLMKWYREEARILPWRSDPTPYHIWISEIMLQQTRVDTVIPYFDRFVSEIPTIQALSQIEEERLLKLWQGLGYYRRALFLKRAASMILKDFNGELPSEVNDLLLLPGIGNYTAGAISSSAYDKREPAVDGNVLRIFARILNISEDIRSTKVRKNIEVLVSNLLPSENPGDFNQALMDLGARICVPAGEPKCLQCPVKDDCQAYFLGRASELPVKFKKKARKIEKRTVFVIRYKDRYALNQRKGGLLDQLWEFPNVEGHLTKEQCDLFIKSYGMEPAETVELTPAKHIFSHLEWHMKGYFVRVLQIHPSADFVWAGRDEIFQKYSLPSAFKNYIALCGARGERGSLDKG